MRWSYVLLALATAVSASDNWPQWRGADQTGVSDATGLPAAWSQDSGVVWKTALPSWSGGTPIVWGDRVFVTSPSPAPPKPEAEAPEPQEGRRRRQRRDPGGEQLMLLCLARDDGRELWRAVLDEGNQTHLKHNNTSPSPVTDGEHVWIVTGTGVVSAFTMAGELAWTTDLQATYGSFGLMWGYASSPTLHDGKVIVEVLHGMRTDDPSYVVAFDAASGEVAWRVERPTDAPNESPDAYTTPAVLETATGPQIVIVGGDYVTGHDPGTGAEVWRVGGLNPGGEGNYRIVGSPVAVGGMIYAQTRKKPLLAFHVGDDGKVGDDDLAWRWEGAGAPDVPTAACDGTRFYMVDDRGLVTALDARSGAVVWGPERTAQGIVSASPVVADGKLYVLNEDGVTTVLSAGAEFEHLATNELDGSYTLSSPAVAGSQLFIRTGTHLYCISN
jgi:outer membrane protein assembly factor BamB